MEITKERAIAKIIFWQQASLIIFALFFCLFCGFAIYDIDENFYYYYWEDYLLEIGGYTLLIVLGIYSIYLLYKSLRLLKSYHKESNHLDLELAFKKQRHFWMIVPIILLFFMAILIVMLISTNHQLL